MAYGYKNIKFKSLAFVYFYIKLDGLIVSATALFQVDVCGKKCFFFLAMAYQVVSSIM